MRHGSRPKIPPYFASVVTIGRRPNSQSVMVRHKLYASAHRVNAVSWRALLSATERTNVAHWRNGTTRQGPQRFTTSDSKRQREGAPKGPSSTNMSHESLAMPRFCETTTWKGTHSLCLHVFMCRGIGGAVSEVSPARPLPVNKITKPNSI